MEDGGQVVVCSIYSAQPFDHFLCYEWLHSGTGVEGLGYAGSQKRHKVVTIDCIMLIINRAYVANT